MGEVELRVDGVVVVSLHRDAVFMIVRESTCLQRQFRDGVGATQERALESGHTIIIENLGESLDAVLAPVIQRATIKRGRTLYVKVGDSEVEFHPDFRC